MCQAVLNDLCLWVCVQCISSAPWGVLTLWRRGNEGSDFQCWTQWETYALDKRQTGREMEWTSRKTVRTCSEARRRTDKQAGGRPTRWPSENTPSQCRQIIVEVNWKKRRARQKHCSSRQLSLTPPHSLLASVSFALSFTPPSGFSVHVLNLLLWPPWPYSSPSYHSDIHLFTPAVSLSLSVFFCSAESFSIFPSHLSGLVARQTEEAL